MKLELTILAAQLASSISKYKINLANKETDVHWCNAVQSRIMY